MPNRVGQQLGNYRLLRLLERSPFAEVYLAEHIAYRTQVAIKVLLVELSADDQERFLSAAQTLTDLVHTNIIQVIEAGSVADQERSLPFLVMEYASHGNLRQRCPIGSRLPLATIYQYVRPMAEALHYAHRQGIIHGDVKPENILLGSNQEVLLSDCSVGVLASSTGIMAGTLAYMAPEQIREHPGPASDQYALGVMIYEWLSGELPFAGSLREITEQHLSAPPPPLRTKIPALSADVEEVILRALAKDPEQRFGNLLAFANALEQVSPPEQRQSFVSPGTAAVANLPAVAGARPGGPPGRGKTPNQPRTALHPGTLPSFGGAAVQPRAARIPRSSPGRISRRALIIGLPAVTIAGGLIAWILNQGQSSTSTALNPMLFTYRGHASAVTAVAWSPDGAYIASGGDDHTIHVWHAQTGKDVFISQGHSGGVPAVAWSPDSTLIASASGGPSTSGGSPAANNAVQVWRATSGKLIYSYNGHSSGITDLAWSPREERIASASTDYTVQVWDATTGKHPLVYRTHPWYVWTVGWSPDGTQIASAGPDGTIQVWDPVTGAVFSTFRGHTSGVEAVAWSPGGTRLASASDDYTVRIWGASSSTLVYSYRGHAGYVHTVAWSPDGNYVVSGSSDKTVQVWNAISGETLYTYHGHSGSVRAAVCSPDGKYVASGSEDGTVQVWQAPWF